jgi:hypothetical protein
MKTLRVVVAGMLLTLPLLSLNASPSVEVGEAAKLEQTHKLTGTCYVYWNGNWYPYPC